MYFDMLVPVSTGKSTLGLDDDTIPQDKVRSVLTYLHVQPLDLVLLVLVGNT